MARPPYVHRWTTLIVCAYVVVVLTATGLSHVPTRVAVAQTVPPAGPAPAAPGLAAPRAVPSSVLTGTAGQGRTVTLTFDDGPNPRYTPRVLDVLGAHRVPAVFCMVTRVAREHRDIARDVLARGHAVCDHTSDHDPGLAARSDRAIAEAMRASSAELVDAAGDPALQVRFFRAPEGRWSPGLARGAATLGMRPLGWSVDSRDWTGASKDAVLHTVRSQLGNGSVILLHDGGGDRATTVAVLEELIPWLRDQGYRFVLPDETADPPRPTPNAGIADAATGR
ncbi:MAG: polysaccharide deacetylase family protein [Actinomycetota bacterium]|nr:polysaccharide deacetylase family protein [Actinomycetota bacterium]